MKTLTLILLSVFGTAAFACPDLSGTYNCGASASDIVTITQSDAAGITTYVINGTNYVVDGNPIVFPDEADVKNQKITYYCEGDKLRDSLTADFYSAGTFQASYLSEFFYSKDITGGLFIEYSEVITGSNGTPMPFAESFTCASVAP